MSPGTAGDHVAALRREGVRDVDDSTLARALYSADASLYRVVPQVVVRPRTVDELAATVAVARATGDPADHARSRYVDRRQRGGHRASSIDTTRHLNRVLSWTPRRAPHRVEPGTVHATLQRAAAPHGLRFGPDPSTHTRCTDRRDDRQQRLRLAGPRLRPDRRQRRRPRRDHGRRGAARRRRARTRRRRARRAGRRHLATIRTEFGRFTRQVSGYSLEHCSPRTAGDCDAPGRQRGHAGVVAGATVRLVEDEPLPGTGRARLPRHVEAADAVPALLHHPLVACEGLDSRIVDVVRPHGRRARPAPRRRLVVRGGHRLHRCRGEAAAAAVVADAGALEAPGGDRPGREGRAVADPRGRRRARRPAAWTGPRTPAGRTPRCRRSGSVRTCAGSTRCCATPGSTGCPTATSATAACTSASTSRSTEPGGAAVPPVRRGRGRPRGPHGGSLSGEHGDGRARCELLPLMYSAAAARRCSAGQGPVRPGRPAQPRRAGRPRAGGRRLRLAGRLVEPRRTLGWRARRRLGVEPCTAAPASASASRTTPAAAA